MSPAPTASVVPDTDSQTVANAAVAWAITVKAHEIGFPTTTTAEEKLEALTNSFVRVFVALQEQVALQPLSTE